MYFELCVIVFNAFTLTFFSIVLNYWCWLFFKLKRFLPNCFHIIMWQANYDKVRQFLIINLLSWLKDFNCVHFLVASTLYENVSLKDWSYRTSCENRVIGLFTENLDLWSNLCFLNMVIWPRDDDHFVSCLYSTIPTLSSHQKDIVLCVVLRFCTWHVFT